MTEEAKQTVLVLFQDILRHGEPEAEMQRFELLYDALVRGLSEEPYSELRRRLLDIPVQMKATIQETRARYERTQRIIAYIEQTPAAELTQEAIVAVL